MDRGCLARDSVATGNVRIVAIYMSTPHSTGTGYMRVIECTKRCEMRLTDMPRSVSSGKAKVDCEADIRLMTMGEYLQRQVLMKANL